MTLSLATSLRQSLKQQRRQLPLNTRRQAGSHIARRIRYLAAIQAAQHIGVYWDDFGEVPTRPLILALFHQGKKIYLPVIRSFDQQLEFVRIDRRSYLQKRVYPHRFGMQQPRVRRLRPIAQLDLLVMPLVAFDGQGMRLGMGGGFYDRTLAKHPHRPYRLGLAYDFQQVARLPVQAWDQPLHACLTPSHHHRFKD